MPGLGEGPVESGPEGRGGLKCGAGEVQVGFGKEKGSGGLQGKGEEEAARAQGAGQRGWGVTLLVGEFLTGPADPSPLPHRRWDWPA